MIVALAEMGTVDILGPRRASLAPGSIAALVAMLDFVGMTLGLWFDGYFSAPVEPPACGDDGLGLRKRHHPIRQGPSDQTEPLFEVEGEFQRRGCLGGGGPRRGLLPIQHPTQTLRLLTSRC